MVHLDHLSSSLLLSPQSPSLCLHPCYLHHLPTYPDDAPSYYPQGMAHHDSYHHQRLDIHLCLPFLLLLNVVLDPWIGDHHLLRAEEALQVGGRYVTFPTIAEGQAAV